MGPADQKELSRLTYKVQSEESKYEAAASHILTNEEVENSRMQ